MSFLQSILMYLVDPILGLLIFLVFVQVIFSWLLAFNIVNLRNATVAALFDAVNRIVNPLLRPIQKIIPSFGGLDFSPIILLLGLYWVRDYGVRQMLYPMLG
ncbi:MAG: YggT family protein [Maricaulaceae bacterium]